jgi:tetratricopeptide (TPR) repeat protein
MQIALPTPAKKAAFLSICLFAAAIYLAFVGKEFLAAYFAEQPDLASLQKAILLQPGRAEYQYRLGQYYALREPETAARFYKSAAALNPHEAIYWLDLSAAYHLLGNANLQKDALEHALAADPRTPEVAWQAANLYWAQGETPKALRQFRVILENDPYRSTNALERCWQIQPDVNALLRDVIPRRVDTYSAFLDFLISRKETSAAATVWSQITQFQQPVERRHVFDYVRYLLEQRDVAQARLVWRQAAALSDLNDYQPWSENLVINGDFNLPVLNAGFDWLYEKTPDASLALDPTELHSGHPSLSVVFDSAGMEDAGIRQLIPVEPNARYEFAAYFKAEDMQGAGGPRFVMEDQFTGIPYFASDELKDADFWKLVTGTFDTGPDAKLLVLRLQRAPAGHPIRGKLWIAGVRLVPMTLAEGAR